MTPPLNDSGCLLGDNDLFDTGLEEGAEPEEEEGLDAIVASVKQKVKKHKVGGHHKYVLENMHSQ